MYGYVYETINLINGKKYIGKHVSNSFDSNYYGSGKNLIKAFNKLCTECDNLYLIIIGGMGIEYDSTMKLVEQLPNKDKIVIIKSLSNPYVI